MEQLFNAAAENWFWSVIGIIVVVWVIAATFDSIIKTSARERSRREIAAYIAEGSMTPEQGERLLKAGRDDASC
ncbi:MAG TPA: hypothetical protein PK400_04915 [Phycisphaerales bacterium]|nr:hypothetical protein [Phycisphaerales bacterium]HRQ76752.1 hypothetical protein [Phycisphaerales bacterium]